MNKTPGGIPLSVRYLLSSRWKSILQKRAVPVVTAAIGFFWYRNKLKDSLSAYQHLYDHHPEAMISAGRRGEIVGMNEKAARITGFKKEDLLGKSINTLFPFKQYSLVEAIANPEMSYMRNIEGRLLTKPGIYKDINISIVKTLHNQKEAAFHLVFDDITEQKRREDYIKFLAYHDELTSLPNRRIITMLVESMIKKEKSFCVMLLDFDGFKQINDHFGHSAGDRFLAQIGKRLVSLSEGKAIVGRLGGDEFLIVFPETECDELAGKIIHGFQDPLRTDHVQAVLTASGGIASYPDDAKSSKQLLEFADKAMYRTKRKGGNDYSHYSSH